MTESEINKIKQEYDQTTRVPDTTEAKLVYHFTKNGTTYRIINLCLTTFESAAFEIDLCKVYLLKDWIIMFEAKANTYVGDKILFSDLTGDGIPEALISQDENGNHGQDRKLTIYDFGNGFVRKIFSTDLALYSMNEFYRFDRDLSLNANGFILSTRMEFLACAKKLPVKNLSKAVHEKSEFYWKDEMINLLSNQNQNSKALVCG